MDQDQSNAWKMVCYKIKAWQQLLSQNFVHPVFCSERHVGYNRYHYANINKKCQFLFRLYT